MSTITLQYSLAELPTSQHRAGLAGLMLFFDWMKDKHLIPDKAICTSELQPDGSVTVRLNKAGLTALMNQIYDATMEEYPANKPYKKNGEIVPYKRKESTLKNGKEETSYIYERPVPRGGPLVHWDSITDASKSWTKLWRDMIWSIPRGIPAQRRPYEDRANKKAPGDVEKVWTMLSSPLKRQNVPSTYFLGAQSSTAEMDAFSDSGKDLFLLHFQPFIIQLYVPVVYEPKKNGTGYDSKHQGYAIAIPDVSDLSKFTRRFGRMMQNRSDEIAGFRPKAALIDLPIEAAVEVQERIQQTIADVEGQRKTHRAVLGYDVLHLEKDGNNIRLRSAQRLSPNPTLNTTWRRLRETMWHPIFRRQRLLNLFDDRPWYNGFDTIFQKQSTENIFGSTLFAHDAAESFKEFRRPQMTNAEQNNRDEYQILYDMVRSYVIGRARQRFSPNNPRFEFQSLNPKQQQQYREEIERVARDAYLTARSRTGSDFVDFFVSTICSEPQRLPQADFLTISHALLRSPEATAELRTLTMLALCAQRPRTTKASERVTPHANET